MGLEGKTGEPKKNDSKKPPSPQQAARDNRLNQIAKGTVLSAENRDVLASVMAGPDMGKLDMGLAAMAGSGSGATSGAGGGNGHGTSTRGGNGNGGGGTNPNVVATAGPQTGGLRQAQGLQTGEPLQAAQVAMPPQSADAEGGGLTAEQVQRTVVASQHTLRYCFDKALLRNSKIDGKVIVYWRIEANGKVSTARVKSSTLSNPDLEDCVVRQVHSWKFDTASNGQVTDVKYPFVFSQS
jgi:TonB family protein